MSPDERETDSKLKSEAKSKNQESTTLNKIWVVRGPPWERRLVQITRRDQGNTPPQQTQE